MVNAILATNESYRKDVIRDVFFAKFAEKSISYGNDTWKHNLFMTTEILNKKIIGIILYTHCKI